MKLVLLGLIAAACAASAVVTLTDIRRVTIECVRPKREPVDFTFDMEIATDGCENTNNGAFIQMFVVRASEWPMTMSIYAPVVAGAPDCLADWTFYDKDGKTPVAWVTGPWTDPSKSENEMNCEQLSHTYDRTIPFCLCTRVAPTKAPTTHRVPERTSPQGR